MITSPASPTMRVIVRSGEEEEEEKKRSKVPKRQAKDIEDDEIPLARLKKKKDR